MSFDATAWAMNQNVGNACRKLVLAALAHHANDDDEAWPSVASIAERCAMSDKGVRNAIAALIEEGFIEIARLQKPRRYRLLRSTGRRKASRETQPMPVSGTERPAPDTGGSDGPIVSDTNDPVRGARESGTGYRQISQESDLKPSGAADAPPCDAKPKETKQARRDDKRGTRLSEDWQPAPQDIEFAERHPTVDWRLQAERFRNYWLARAGNAARKTDWSRTWQNWILNEARYAAERGGKSRFGPLPAQASSGPPGSPQEIWQGRLARFRVAGFWLRAWGPKPGEEGCRATQDADTAQPNLV